ncbi:Crp/Fnr family transcriptional regulator [Mesorhizobium sp. KR1-2]|uniref:Crp/Fnr family transcriptional regulator n=1 Tax=Mesorhizobium sp. KR1-2 TaxID=3156609 RepID=UPI0032B60BFE
MSEQTLLQFVKSPPICVSLSIADVDSDFLGITPKHYPPDTVFDRQGDTRPRVFIIKSGWVCISRHLSNGNRQIIDVPLAGDVLFIPSLDGGGANSLTSLSEVSVFEISGQVFRKALDRHPMLSALFSRIIARQHSIAVERLTSVCRRNALERTAHYLLELGERLGAAGAITEHGYSCPLTQHDLADVLGLTQIHINRILRELRERELVSFRAGTVEFLSRPKLVNLAGFEGGYLHYNWTYGLHQIGASRQASHHPPARKTFKT